MPEFTPCNGSDVLADVSAGGLVAFCGGCHQYVDTYRDSLTGQDLVRRFIPHARELRRSVA